MSQKDWLFLNIIILLHGVTGSTTPILISEESMKMRISSLKQFLFY